MSEQKYDCKVIQDLLPLYHDGVCSESSKTAVEEHLKECSECQKVASQLDNYEVDQKIQVETNDVLLKHEKKERKRTYTVGIVTASILTIPIIVCLICNLAIGHALDWFFIVLAGMLLVGSVTVVPMVVSEKKGLWTILSSTVSLLLVLLVCCIYTQGDWFFIAAVGSLLAISIIFAPYILNNLTLVKYLSDKKGLLAMASDTVLIYLLLFVCGIFMDCDMLYWKMAFSTSSISLLIPWGIFLIVRYMHANAYTKTGIILIILGFVTALANDIICKISGVQCYGSIFKLNMQSGFVSEDPYVTNGNILFVELLVLLIAGTTFLVIGMKKNQKK